jgi:hypothetical protein
MIIKVLEEHGYPSAALGFSLSYNSGLERAMELLPKFAFGKSGETKFLESIYVWLDVTAPIFMWSEMDTYRISTKQSESTMHTLTKRVLTHEDFECPISDNLLEELNHAIHMYKTCPASETFAEEKRKIFLLIKNNLPSGFLQRRIWVINYRTLQNIYNQRHDHKLPQWRYFCEQILVQVEHPEFIQENYVA